MTTREGSRKSCHQFQSERQTFSLAGTDRQQLSGRMQRNLLPFDQHCRDNTQSINATFSCDQKTSMQQLKLKEQEKHWRPQCMTEQTLAKKVQCAFVCKKMYQSCREQQTLPRATNNADDFFRCLHTGRYTKNRPFRSAQFLSLLRISSSGNR